MYMYYGFGFLTLDQTYLCRSTLEQEYRSCSATQICEALQAGLVVDYIVDKTDRNYMINWIQQMGLICTPRVSI